MRNELSGFEWVAIKPMLPNKVRASAWGMQFLNLKQEAHAKQFRDAGCSGTAESATNYDQLIAGRILSVV